jgi:hypothetical protein
VGASKRPRLIATATAGAKRWINEATAADCPKNLIDRDRQSDVTRFHRPDMGSYPSCLVVKPTEMLLQSVQRPGIVIPVLWFATEPRCIRTPLARNATFFVDEEPVGMLLGRQLDLGPFSGVGRFETRFHCLIRDQLVIARSHRIQSSLRADNY